MHLDYVSDDEAITKNPNLKLEEDLDEKILLRVLSRVHSNPAIKLVPYNRKLDTNVVLDWISKMEKLFECEGTLDNKKVKIVVTRLKGHASLWWERLQINRQRKGK